MSGTDKRRENQRRKLERTQPWVPIAKTTSPPSLKTTKPGHNEESNTSKGKKKGRLSCQKWQVSYNELRAGGRDSHRPGTKAASEPPDMKLGITAITGNRVRRYNRNTCREGSLGISPNEEKKCHYHSMLPVMQNVRTQWVDFIRLMGPNIWGLVLRLTLQPKEAGK